MTRSSSGPTLPGVTQPSSPFWWRDSDSENSVASFAEVLARDHALAQAAHLRHDGRRVGAGRDAPEQVIRLTGLRALEVLRVVAIVRLDLLPASARAGRRASSRGRPPPRAWRPLPHAPARTRARSRPAWRASASRIACIARSRAMRSYQREQVAVGRLALPGRQVEDGAVHVGRGDAAAVEGGHRRCRRRGPGCRRQPPAASTSAATAAAPRTRELS